MFNKLREILGVAPQQKPQLKGDYLPMQQKAKPIQQIIGVTENNGGTQTLGSSNYSAGQVSPVDRDAVVGNVQRYGRKGLIRPEIQGSNPFMNNPYRNQYQNVYPMDMDSYMNTRMIQPSRFDLPEQVDDLRVL